MMTISRLLFFALICAAARMSLAVDQIEITAITRDGDCTTLTWASRPGEFYTVYWTDAMSDTPFWRIAAVNLPSEGGTTTWSDGDCGDMMGMSLPPGSDPSAQPLSPEELAVKRAEAQVRAQTSIEFLTQKLAEAVAKWQSQQTAPDSESTTESLDSGPQAPGPPKFFGASEWYIMATVESYNGILQSWFYHHGDYGDWFSSEAFLRPNYEATPAGAVCHVAEPGRTDVQDPAKYFRLWSRGRCFGICAWKSARTPNLLVVGDPLVRE